MAAKKQVFGTLRPRGLNAIGLEGGACWRLHLMVWLREREENWRAERNITGIGSKR